MGVTSQTYNKLDFLYFQYSMCLWNTLVSVASLFSPALSDSWWHGGYEKQASRDGSGAGGEFPYCITRKPGNIATLYTHRVHKLSPDRETFHC